MCSIGIDIGKTNIKLVVLDGSGKVVDRDQFSTPEDKQVVALVRDQAMRYRATDEGQTHSLGISAPGLAGPDLRKISHLPGGQPAIEGIDWTYELQWPTPVTVLNDANAAMYAEYRQGAARGYRHAIMLTLGTGVGGSILINGRLLHGKTGKAGHLGHISIHPDWTKSILGMPGSLEYAFGDWSVEQRSQGRFKDTQAMVAALGSGDKEADSLWQEAIGHLARGIASLTNVLDPEVVVIGGGITQAGETLFKPLREVVAAIEWQPTGRPVPIVPAQLGSESGAIGAALYAEAHAGFVEAT